MPATSLATSPTAYIEPGTLSVCLYCAALLFRGRAGSRLLARHLRRDREVLADVAMDELSNFLCDHTDALLMLLLVSGSFWGPSHLSHLPEIRRCGLVRAVRRGSRTLSRSIDTIHTVHTVRQISSWEPKSPKLLHLLRRAYPAQPGDGLLQAKAYPQQPEPLRRPPLPADPLRVPVLLRRARRVAGAALHFVRQLAAAGLRAGQENQERW